MEDYEELKARADRLAREKDLLEHKVHDLEQMIGELPDEGKSAMLVVTLRDGEYLWDSRPFDFASYHLVDLEDDVFYGNVLCDPFAKAEPADEITVAKQLRLAADALEWRNDYLSAVEGLKSYIEDARQLLRDMFFTWKRLDLEGDWPDSGHNGWKTFERRLEELGVLVGGSADMERVGKGPKPHRGMSCASETPSKKLLIPWKRLRGGTAWGQISGR